MTRTSPIDKKPENKIMPNESIKPYKTGNFWMLPRDAKIQTAGSVTRNRSNITTYGFLEHNNVDMKPQRYGSKRPKASDEPRPYQTISTERNHNMSVASFLLGSCQNTRTQSNSFQSVCREQIQWLNNRPQTNSVISQRAKRPGIQQS